MRTKRGGAFDIMSPVEGIDFILVDIQEIKDRFINELLDRDMKTLEELLSKADFKKYHIERINPNILNHTLQMYVIDINTRKIICIISFIINNESMGYIDFVTCGEKIDKYHPSSYLAFYQVLKIFDHFDIPHCYLMVNPDLTRYWKLYRFYAAMGFYCLGVKKKMNNSLMMKINNVKQLSPNNRNKYLKTRKNTNTFLRNKNAISNSNRSNENSTDYFYNCYNMFGNVKEILIKLKTTLNIE